ncbi:hypothetical protein [Metabacillus hrfriensis]|uniref:Uncharacterized protein n=1 Tax=Metabacillus hrfriensis TaxID=3048891 RepID=A0ACD4R8P0_9BACI|nr:hypothetical protein [Metabacillus sp. CT-WN-B3]WHZ56814.1 hypothetical protein QLQ22_19285 [Metabacillus sp. CT-WN-B3]
MTNAGNVLKHTAPIPNKAALFSLPSDGNIFSRLKAPVLALFKLMENMDISEQRKITITIGMGSVKELADMNGFSWL